MNFIDRLVRYFKKPKKEKENPSLGGTCPVCWGSQEYGGKVRKIYQDKQVDVNHGENSYIKSKKFVVEHIEGIRYKKGEIEECPECGRQIDTTE